jgi:3-oxoacyl-[acyl-carrier-protein] synthase-3
MTVLYINACESYIPKHSVSVAEAVANEWYDAGDAEADGYRSATVETEYWPGDMAVLAAQKALHNAEIAELDLSLLTYSSIHRHGHKQLWQPAAYIQHQLLATNAMALSVQHGCNALMLSVALALDHCRAQPKRKALLVSSDRFEHSYFDRWQSDYGLIYGDAAVAVVMSTDIGPFKVLYYDQMSVPSLESMHRNPEPEPETEASLSRQYDIREAKKAYLVLNGRETFEQTLSSALKTLRHRLIEHTELQHHMADWLVLPNVGKRVLNSVYQPVFADLAIGDLWQAGQQIGHAGASDQFIGLSLLAESGELRPGHLILLVGAGAGFSCSVLLLQVTEHLVNPVA